jgi:hypothetical protein
LFYFANIFSKKIFSFIQVLDKEKKRRRDSEGDDVDDLNEAPARKSSRISAVNIFIFLHLKAYQIFISCDLKSKNSFMCFGQFDFV